MENPKIYGNFLKTEPINKGWSNDKKYCVEITDGRRMLLRVSDIEEIDRKKAEYSMMERVYALGVLTPEPFEFGICDSGKNCYSLSGWLNGEDAESALTRISETEQYSMGLKAGEILRKIHTIPAPENAEPWSERFLRKVHGRIDFYNANITNLTKSENEDMIIRYLTDNKNLLEGRSQTFNHGDFNISNMMIMPDGQIGVIDFNAFNKDYGDPWWEFHSVSWDGEKSAHFFTGIVKSYFNGDPPRNFFDVLSYYFAYDVLAGLCSRLAGVQGEPDDSEWAIENIACDFNHYVMINLVIIKNF